MSNIRTRPRVRTDRGGDDIPAIARRTYSLLRLGMVGVLLALATSLVLEATRSGCVQTSISAYYYTPTRAVFVGALVSLGVSMIVLWGKTWLEDGFLNLAGMLAPVVAFVPTSNANLCSVSGSTKDAANHQASQLIDTTHQAMDNNVETLGIVVGLALLGVLVAVVTDSPWAALLRTRPGAWHRDPTFCVTYGLALALWVVGFIAFTTQRSLFYERAHGTSAATLFLFIVVVVAANAWNKREGWVRDGRDADDRRRLWMMRYATLVALMVAAGVTIKVVGHLTPDSWFGVHQTLLLEAALLALFAIFWVLQTVDRRDEGAPTLAQGHTRGSTLV
jgi:hypothetical protein